MVVADDDDRRQRVAAELFAPTGIREEPIGPTSGVLAACLTTTPPAHRLGVVSDPPALYSGCGCACAVGMAYDCFLVHAPRPPIDTLIERATQLAPSRGACRGVMEAA